MKIWKKIPLPHDQQRNQNSRYSYHLHFYALLPLLHRRDALRENAMKIMYINTDDIYQDSKGAYIAPFDKLMNKHTGKKDCIPCGCYLRFTYQKIRLEYIFIGFALSNCKPIQKYFEL